MLSDPEVVAMLRWFLEGLSLAVLLATGLYIFQQWGDVPPRVPSHFNWRGRPDAWSGRWILPVMLALSVVLYAGLSVAGGTARLIQGDIAARMREALVLTHLKFWVTALMGYSIVTMVRVARGKAERFQVLVVWAAAVLMAAPAILMGAR